MKKNKFINYFLGLSLLCFILGIIPWSSIDSQVIPPPVKERYEHGDEDCFVFGTWACATITPTES